LVNLLNYSVNRVEEVASKCLKEKMKESESGDAMVMVEEFTMLPGKVSTSIINRYLRKGRIKGIRVMLLGAKNKGKVSSSSIYFAPA
jgi:GH24 family phage-related lysozyme (muramidase)